jgi:large subunit ribosomal protein L10
VPNQQKVAIVNGLKEMLAEMSTVILTDHSGLGVKDIFALRARLREPDARFHVVKNTLFKLAAAGTQVEAAVADLEGPTSVVITKSDPVAVAKALAGFIREFKILALKGGMVEGRVVTAAEVQSLSTIPSRPELLAHLVGGLQSPIAGLVRTLQSTVANLVMTLQAVAQKQAA